MALAVFVLKHDSKNLMSLNSEVIYKTLSEEEYKNIEKSILDLVEKENPRVALDELRLETKNNSALLAVCHSIVHEIGHEAYEKYTDFGIAMQYQDEFCNSGYLHGIIEAHFNKSTDIFTTMQDTCKDFPLGKFMSFECLHGIGHGLMYFTSNDLPKSLEYCSKFNSSFARENCSNGVFMENFNVDQKLHISKYLDPSNPFFPCNIQDENIKEQCYIYAPIYYLSLNPREYINALTWCETTELGFTKICTHGVGSQAMKENIDNPEIVEKICESGTIGQKTSCIMGMTTLYINHYGELGAGKKLCNKLNFSNKSTCYSTLDHLSHLF